MKAAIVIIIYLITYINLYLIAHLFVEKLSYSEGLIFLSSGLLGLPLGSKHHQGVLNAPEVSVGSFRSGVRPFNILRIV